MEISLRFRYQDPGPFRAEIVDGTIDSNLLDRWVVVALSTSSVAALLKSP